MVRNFVCLVCFCRFVPYKKYWVVHYICVSPLLCIATRVIYISLKYVIETNSLTFSRRKKESSFFPRSWRGTNEIKTRIIFDIKVVIAVNVLSRSVYFMALELRPPTIKMGCLNFLLLILCYTFNSYYILLIGF